MKNLSVSRRLPTVELSANPHYSSDKLLTEQEAAAYLGISPGTMSVWRCTGRYKLIFVRVGRRIRYRKQDLDNWLDARTCANGATA